MVRQTAQAHAMIFSIAYAKLGGTRNGMSRAREAGKMTRRAFVAGLLSLSIVGIGARPRASLPQPRLYPSNSLYPSDTLQPGRRQ